MYTIKYKYFYNNNLSVIFLKTHILWRIEKNCKCLLFDVCTACRYFII